MFLKKVTTGFLVMWIKNGLYNLTNGLYNLTWNTVKSAFMLEIETA